MESKHCYDNDDAAAVEALFNIGYGVNKITKRSVKEDVSTPEAATSRRKDEGKIMTSAEEGPSEAGEDHGARDNESRPQLRHHLCQANLPRKRMKGGSDKSDGSETSGSSERFSSDFNRSSSGYEGGKSGSNGGSLDSMSVTGQRNDSDPGSDDGYCNMKSVKFSQMPFRKNDPMEEVACGSPTSSSSSDCSSTDDVVGSDVVSGATVQQSLAGNNSSATSLVASATTAETASVVMSQKPHAADASTSKKVKISTSNRLEHHRPGASARQLQPAPYFYYRDHSQEPDDDQSIPFSPPLYVPNFAAKVNNGAAGDRLASFLSIQI